MSKKRIIAIITIIVLLLAAGISVGVFLYDKGQTEATDGNQTSTTIPEENQTDGNDTVLPEESTSNENTENGKTEENQVTNNDNATSNDVVNNNVTNNNANNTDITTRTDVERVEETTITRIEEQERLISEKFSDWWKPMEVEINPTKIGVETQKIVVNKTATTGIGKDNLVKAGQEITYIIAVTNNDSKDAESIEITDKIPEQTKYVDGSICDAYILKEVNGKQVRENLTTKKATIKSENTIIGIKWIVTIPAEKTVYVSFTVKVDEEATGTILNSAIANGEESNKTKTAIISTYKTSTIKRQKADLLEYKEVEIAKIGDIITYTIAVENTGFAKGNVDITDTIPEGTKLISTDLNVDEKGKITWSNVEVPAATELNGEIANAKVEITFDVEVISIDKEIENVATVDGGKTNKDIIETADIEIEKVVSNIQRGNEFLDITNGIPEVKEGDVIGYTITVTNTGSLDLTNVIVTDELEGIKVNPEDLDIGNLKSGETVEIKATYEVKYEADILGNANREICNKATVSGETKPEEENPEKEPERVYDEDDETVPVAPDSRISIVKTETAVNGTSVTSENKNNVKVRPDDIVEYTIVVTNTGNTTLTDVVVTDTLDVIVENNKETTKAGNPIKTIDSLEPAESVEIKTYYKVQKSDVKEEKAIHNVATVTAKTPDEGETLEKKSEEDVPVNPDVTVSGTKTWNDANDQDGARPDSITIRLFADGVEVTGKTATVSADTNWAYEFTNLPKYSAGTEIVYTVSEDTVEGYTTTISGYNVTNTHTPETINISGSKTWNDANDQDGARPDSITIRLFADGAEVKTATVTAKDNWAYTFTDLPVNKAGNRITYTISEDAVTGYETTSITGNATNGFTITNTLKTNVDVTKVWNDNNNSAKARPDSITIRLFADGAEVKTATVTAKDKWAYEFTDLLKYDAQENEIVYTVTEESVEGYITSITGDATNGFTITNTYNNVIVNKKTLTSQEESESSEPNDVDVMFILDISGSMVNNKVSAGNGASVTRAKAMVDAANKAITTIMSKNSNNRIGVTMFNGDASVVLELKSYTAATTVDDIGQYLLYTETTTSEDANKPEMKPNKPDGGQKTTYTITTNVTDVTAVPKEITGGTYTQYGIATGANGLATSNNTTKRTPVIILLTDGEPTYATTNYSDVTSTYNVGNGSENDFKGDRGYLTVLTANHYKNLVKAHYSINNNNATALMYTIGIGMDGNYNRTVLNPIADNVNACNTQAQGKAKELYDYLKGNESTISINNNPGEPKQTVEVRNPYPNYEYADGSWAGDMDAETLNNILTNIIQNVTKTYSTTTTTTTNLNVGDSIIELTNLDANEKITIVLDGNSQEYSLAELLRDDTNTERPITLEDGKYYMNLKANMFNNVKEIEITYYEAHQ